MATPCFAATLTGSVTDDNGVAVYKARVLILNDLSLALSQRKNTDFNGRYHFDLDPGPYRILLLREGFQPVFEAVLILHEAEQLKVDFKLKPLEALANNREDPKAKNEENRTNRIKEVFRGSNLNPMREDTLHAYAPASQVDHENPAVAGQIRSGSRRDLQGELEQTRSLEVKTRISDTMALASAYADAKNALGQNTVDYAATMSVELPEAVLALMAQTRRHGDFPEHVSDRAQFAAKYGEDLPMATVVDMQASKSASADQRFLSLNQNMTLELGQSRVSGQLDAADWRDQGDSYASRAQLGVRWQSMDFPFISGATEIESLDAGGIQTQREAVWMAFHNVDKGSGPRIKSEFGYQDQAGAHAWMQRHRFGITLGLVALEAHYADERNLLSLTSTDLFGSYLSSNATPYLHEGFVDDHRREFGLEVGFKPTTSLDTVFTWQRTRNLGQVRYSRRADFFRNDAEREEDRLGLGVQVRDYDATLHYTYAYNQSTSANFALQALSYRQNFSPFRNKALGLHLELILQDTPDLSSWYLFESLPWLESRENWYEGRLALQF